MSESIGNRGVDQAMNEDRPEKQTVRGLWIDLLQNYSNAYTEDAYPLYLTLSGAEGRDIELLVRSGLLEVTETGAVVEEQKLRVIAIESNARAVIALQRRFPGLKILEVPFQALIRGTSAMRWPTGDDEQFCRARVINLDLNQPLKAECDPGLSFPVLMWVRKLSQLHAAEQLDWSLCLTLHGEITETIWSDEAAHGIQQFLAENFAREPDFASMSRSLLGAEVFDALVSADRIAFRDLGREDQQKILMILVPKKIAHLVHVDGWRVETARNLRYGGTSGRAPMVTWVFDFTWEPSAFTQPDSVYRDCLRGCLEGAAKIAEDGSIS